MTEPPPKSSLFRSMLGVVAAQGAKKAAGAAGSAAVGAIGWPAILASIAIILLVIAVLIVTCIVALMRTSDQRQLLNYQCESRLGYSVGNTASLTAVPRLATSVTVASTDAATTWETTELQPATTAPPTRTPTTTTSTPDTTAPATTSGQLNPYATQTVPASADEQTKACASALRSGDLVGAPLQRPGTAVGLHAAELANQQVGLQTTAGDGTLAGPTNNAFSAANLVRYAYYQATAGGTILPETIADQITVGDRVDPNAISPGDLVYFNFTPTGGPTSVMIAISATLGVDATTVGQPIALGVLPTGNIIVKRSHTEVPAA